MIQNYYYYYSTLPTARTNKAISTAIINQTISRNPCLRSSSNQFQKFTVAMDATTTPPSQRTKSASRLSKLRYYSESPIPKLSLDLVPLSPKLTTPSPASTISPRPPYTAPLRELLMFSPSQIKRSKTRLAERIADEAIDRKRSKKNCSASPRNTRRSSRRRIEQEVREDIEDEGLVVKPRKKKKRKPSKSNKEDDKAIVVVPQSPNSETNDAIATQGCNLDKIGEVITDLVMWRDVSKSSLWFGFGSLCLLSSCFTRSIHFSMFSCISQLGLLFLGLSFFSNTLRQRNATAAAANETKSEFKLTEDDILKVGRLILPAANLLLAITRQVFSGEPSMTLKVIPFMILGAEYGHLITLWRLLGLGFIISFTCPILYTAYSAQLSNKVERLKCWAVQTWGSCTHKKIAAGSVVSAFWNLTSVRTRIIAAFLCLVVLRYSRQHCQEAVEAEVPTKQVEVEEVEQQQAKESVVLEVGATK